MMKATRRISKRMKELRGKLRQKQKGGPYYYRLTVANGLRKEFALKTSVEAEAIQRATDIDAVYEAPNRDVALAQINAIKGFSKRALGLPLSDVWQKYEESPNRAHPLVAEHRAYNATYREFASFVTGEMPGRSVMSPTIANVSEVSHEVVAAFVEYLKSTNISVHTHNRKLKRLRKIFDCLSDFYDGENPFRSKGIFRKEREEQDTVVRRLAFTQEQEQQLRDVLADSTHRVMNKREIRCIYYIGMYAGQRLKDCVLLQWQNVDMAHQRIFVKQFKTGKEVTIPIAAPLFEVLKEAQEWRVDQYVCPKSAARYNKTDKRGKNVGNNLVDIDVLRVIRWIGLEPSVDVPGRDKKMTVYGFHSLRHSFCSFCAAAGVPKAVLLSILGTQSEIADKYYTHVGEAAQREAIDAISVLSGSKSAQDKINEVLALLNQNPEPTQELLERIKQSLT